MDDEKKTEWVKEQYGLTGANGSVGSSRFRNCMEMRWRQNSQSLVFLRLASRNLLWRALQPTNQPNSAISKQWWITRRRQNFCEPQPESSYATWKLKSRIAMWRLRQNLLDRSWNALQVCHGAERKNEMSKWSMKSLFAACQAFQPSFALALQLCAAPVLLLNLSVRRKWTLSYGPKRSRISYHPTLDARNVAGKKQIALHNPKSTDQ